MLDIISVLFKRVFAYLLSLLALLNLTPNKPAQPGAPAEKPYVFNAAQEYQNYYFYCTEEDPEPYSWSPEALAARENVDRMCTAEGFSVTLFKNGTARIDALTAPQRDVTVPAEVEGCPVVAVYGILPRNDYDTAGKIADTVKTLVLPDSVEYIMEGAFEDLSNLRSVQFGGREKYMEPNAFRDCVYLTGVILPDSLEEIPAVAFNGCLALTKVGFGKDLRTVGRYAFEFCALRKVTLPDTVRVLEEYAFAQCRSLTYVYVPASVTEIGRNAFGRCDRLTIHGETGSAAQRYAEENGIPFKAGK